MYVTNLLQYFQVVGLRTYWLENLIGSVELIVEFFAWPFYLNVYIRQPGHVTYSLLVGFCTLISILPLYGSYLLLVLLNCSQEFNKPIGPHFGILHIKDGSVS
jgi:hypothetical protein